MSDKHKDDETKQDCCESYEDRLVKEIIMEIMQEDEHEDSMSDQYEYSDIKQPVDEAYLSQFCTASWQRFGWYVEALEDGLEKLTFNFSNQEALLFAKVVMQANGITIPDDFPDNKQLLHL